MTDDDSRWNHPAGTWLYCKARDGECSCWMSAKVHRVQSDHECISCGKVWSEEVPRDDG